MAAAAMGFNMFLADDLVAACTQRFKRSKIEGPTYRRACQRFPSAATGAARPDPAAALARAVLSESTSETSRRRTSVATLTLEPVGLCCAGRRCVGGVEDVGGLSVRQRTGALLLRHAPSRRNRAAPR